MSLPPLQFPLDNLIEYMSDAQRIYCVLEERIQKLTDERRERGSRTGAGAPTVQNKSLNRAVVLAAVGAWEAFCEDLALTGQQEDPGSVPPESWYRIGGTKGMVQTPNSSNVRRLFWTLFRYDPIKDWCVEIQVSPTEIGQSATRWRIETKQCLNADAAKFIDAMVLVRHGFAHQDKAAIPPAYAGIVEKTPSGKISIQSHHAHNSLSALVQLAILTTHGLADALNLQPRLRWSRDMNEAGWTELLAGTTAGKRVATAWKASPSL